MLRILLKRHPAAVNFHYVPESYLLSHKKFMRNYGVHVKHVERAFSIVARKYSISRLNYLPLQKLGQFYKFGLIPSKVSSMLEILPVVHSVTENLKEPSRPASQTRTNAPPRVRLAKFL